VGGEKDEKGRKHCFFEKKQQKTFVSWVTGVVTGTGTESESFLVLFSKKNRFPLNFPRAGPVN